MSNTIELLESIGRDASLRHASQENLMQLLAGMDASASLQMAAATGNRSHLAQELGYRTYLALQVNHNPGAPDEDDMENGPDREGDETDDTQTPEPEL